MQRFVEGEDRQQIVLLPPCLDDYVTENNPVRVIEAFVDELDLATLGVEGVVPNGICERFHKTLLDEFYRVAFRKKVYDTPDALQADLDEWMAAYNEQRTHQGRWCFGKTPMQTFLDSAAWAHEKQNTAKAA